LRRRTQNNICSLLLSQERHRRDRVVCSAGCAQDRNVKTMMWRYTTEGASRYVISKSTARAINFWHFSKSDFQQFNYHRRGLRCSNSFLQSLILSLWLERCCSTRFCCTKYFSMPSIQFVISRSSFLKHGGKYPIIHFILNIISGPRAGKVANHSTSWL